MHCCFEILSIDVTLLGIVSCRQAGLCRVDVVSLCTLDPSWSAGITNQPLHGVGSGRRHGKTPSKGQLWPLVFLPCPAWEGLLEQSSGGPTVVSSPQRRSWAPTVQHLAGCVDASPWGYGMGGTPRQLQQLLSPSSLCPHTLHHPLCHVYKTVLRLVQGFLLLSWQTPKDQASAITSSRYAS